MKKNFSFLYLLPQLFFTLLFLLALFLGLWESFTVEGHGSIAHYKEIFTRGDTLPSIFYTLRVSFLSSLFTLLLSSMEVPIELRKILEQSKVYIPCSFLSKIRNQSGLRLPGNRKPRKEYESLLRCSGLSKKHFRSMQYLILNR